jgi:hypothetical protein
MPKLTLSTDRFLGSIDHPRPSKNTPHKEETDFMIAFLIIFITIYFVLGCIGAVSLSNTNNEVRDACDMWDMVAYDVGLSFSITVLVSIIFISDLYYSKNPNRTEEKREIVISEIESGKTEIKKRTYIEASLLFIWTLLNAFLSIIYILILPSMLIWIFVSPFYTYPSYKDSMNNSICVSAMDNHRGPMDGYVLANVALSYSVLNFYILESAVLLFFTPMFMILIECIKMII